MTWFWSNTCALPITPKLRLGVYSNHIHPSKSRHISAQQKSIVQRPTCPTVCSGFLAPTPLNKQTPSALRSSPTGTSLQLLPTKIHLKVCNVNTHTHTYNSSKVLRNATIMCCTLDIKRGAVKTRAQQYRMPAPLIKPADHRDHSPASPNPKANNMCTNSIMTNHVLPALSESTLEPHLLPQHPILKNHATSSSDGKSLYQAPCPLPSAQCQHEQEHDSIAHQNRHTVLCICNFAEQYQRLDNIRGESHMTLSYDAT